MILIENFFFIEVFLIKGKCILKSISIDIIIFRTYIINKIANFLASEFPFELRRCTPQWLKHVIKISNKLLLLELILEITTKVHYQGIDGIIEI